jgi:hypothetical protein
MELCAIVTSAQSASSAALMSLAASMVVTEVAGEAAQDDYEGKMLLKE